MSKVGRSSTLIPLVRIHDLSTALNNTSQKKPLLNFFIDRYKEAYKIQLNDLFRMISKKKKPLANFEDGGRALIIANAAYESLKKRKSVKVNFN